MAATAPTGTATAPKTAGGDQVAGGGVAGPQDDRGDGQDGELAGGEAGQQLVGPLDVGRDAHPGPVTSAVVAAGLTGRLRRRGPWRPCRR